MKLRTFAMALAIQTALTTAALALDPALPTYQRVGNLTGQLRSVGSDTLNQEMELWAAGFKGVYPGVKIEIEGKGSATAPPALLTGRADFGPMSRLMNGNEADAFEKEYGYKATSVGVAVDALAIYVNKENPIQCITVTQLNRIFSKTPMVSGGDNIDIWGQLGLSGEWAAQPISMYGRNTISGTYDFFRQQALYGGDFKEAVKQEVGSEAVVRAVANNKFGIGYSGIGYKTEGVRAVPVAVHEGQKCYDTSPENTYSGGYPIARLLYIYVNKKPSEPLDQLHAEFIKYILSKDGQDQVAKGGYYPVTMQIREDNLKRLENAPNAAAPIASPAAPSTTAAPERAAAEGAKADPSQAQSGPAAPTQAAEPLAAAPPTPAPTATANQEKPSGNKAKTRGKVTDHKAKGAAQ